MMDLRTDKLEMLMTREQLMEDVLSLFEGYSNELSASVQEELQEGVLDLICKHYPAS